MEVMSRAMLEVGEVFYLEVIEAEGHSQVLRLDWHGSSSRSAAPHDHGRAGARHGPAKIGGDLASLHLPAAAFIIVVGVLAFAIRPYRTAVVDVMTQLAHVLDHHVHAVRLALAQMPAAGVVRPPSAEFDGAIADVVPALALLAEAVVLELQHGRECERVVGARDVNVLRADARIGPEDLAGIPAGYGRDWTCLVVHVDAGLAHPARDAANKCQRVLEIARVIRARDDDGGGVVGLHTAVEQMQRLADHPACEHLLHGYALLVIGLWIVGGMIAVRSTHCGDLLGLGAVVVHVTHEGGAEHLPSALPAVGTAMQHVARHWHRRARAGAADAHLREAVHGAEDGDRLAHTGLDHAHGNADQGLC